MSEQVRSNYYALYDSEKYAEYLREEYKSGYVYFDQLGNIVWGIVRFSVYWLMYTLFFTTSILLLYFLFLVEPETEIALSEFIIGLRELTLAVAVFNFVSCFFLNSGNFKWVFSDYAKRRAVKHQKIKHRHETNRKEIDSVLLEYNLIERS